MIDDSFRSTRLQHSAAQLLYSGGVNQTAGKGSQNATSCLNRVRQERKCDYAEYSTQQAGPR